MKYRVYDRGGRCLGEVEAPSYADAEHIALRDIPESVRIVPPVIGGSISCDSLASSKVVEEKKLMKFQVCNEYGQVVGDVQADAIHAACEIATKEFPTGSYLRFEEKGKEIQESIVRPKPPYMGPTVHEAAKSRLRQIKDELEELYIEQRMCRQRLQNPTNARMLESERLATQADPFQATQLPVR